MNVCLRVYLVSVSSAECLRSNNESWVCLIRLCHLPARSQFPGEAGEPVFIWTSYRGLLTSCLPHDLAVLASAFVFPGVPSTTSPLGSPIIAASSHPCSSLLFPPLILTLGKTGSQPQASSLPPQVPLELAYQTALLNFLLGCVCLSGAQAAQLQVSLTLGLALLVCCLISSC